MSEKAIAVRKTKETPMNLINTAIANGASVEVLQQLFELQKSVKVEQAREAFTEALAEFQSECPIIQKTKKVMNKDGRTVRYVYAPIDAIVEQIKKPLSDNGFSYTFTVENDDKMIKATAKVTHKLGHSETSTFTIPVDPEGYMTAPQKIASALTFAKRYALCNALGISTGEDDTDATDVGKEPEPKNDKSKIILLLRNLGEKTSTFEECKEAVYRLTKLELADNNFPEIVTRLAALVEEIQNGEQ